MSTHQTLDTSIGWTTTVNAPSASTPNGHKPATITREPELGRAPLTPAQERLELVGWDEV